MTVSADPILDRLIARAEDLVRQLLPGARLEAGELVARGEDTGCGKVAVVLRGRKRGLVAFWGGRPDKPAATGGTLIHLIMAVRGLDRRGARAFAAQWLGEPHLVAAPVTRAAAPKRDDDAEAARRARSLAAARRLVWAARPQLHGTAAEAYLATRGIERATLAFLTRDVRCGQAEHWKSGWRLPNGQWHAGPTLPAIVCAVTLPSGQISGAHVTFLREDGGGKAAVDAPKLMRGEILGSVIQVGHGASGVAPDVAATMGLRGPVVLTEGLEDAITAVQLRRDLRVWAVTSLANLAHAPVWHAAVTGVIVCADNDWDELAALRAFDRAMEALQRHGKPISVIRSAAGKDINDMIKEMDR
jgi:hypothetical protein